VSDPPIKRCLCGAAYTKPQWDALHYVGLSDLAEGKIELRLCGSCRSTIAILVHPTREGARRRGG
jgi:hypothetical protein